MEVRQLSVAEIVAETVEYYSADPKGKRGTNTKGGCEYLIEGRMCAVGRCAIDPSTLEGVCDNILVRNRDTGKLSSLDTGLRFQYRGHSEVFWSYLQDLHDANINWDDDGITIEGQQMADNIIDDHHVPTVH